jgi:tetratricopeptide (TPR) repeat protein
MHHLIRPVAILLAVLMLPIAAAAADNPLVEARELLERGKYTKALEILQPMVEADPANRSAVVMIGDCLHLMLQQSQQMAKKGKFKQATRLLSDLIQADPENRDALIMMGDCLMQMKFEKRESQAVQYYKEAIKLDPTDAEAQFKLGAAYDYFSDVDLAFKQYKIVKKLDPEKAKILYKMIFMEE